MIAAKRLRYPLPGSRWNEYQALWPPGFEMPGLDPEPPFKIGPVARGHWKVRDANTIELGESFYSAATNNIQVIMTKIGDIDQEPRL